MLVGAGQRNGVRVLQPETLQLMFSDQLGDVPGDLQFGLGFAINDIDIGAGDHRRQVQEYSWGGYASTSFRLVPELGLFQVFLRQHVPSQTDLAQKVLRNVYQEFGASVDE